MATPKPYAELFADCGQCFDIMGCETTRLDRWEEMLEAARTDGHIHAHRLFAIGPPSVFNSFRQKYEVARRQREAAIRHPDRDPTLDEVEHLVFAMVEMPHYAEAGRCPVVQQ